MTSARASGAVRTEDGIKVTLEDGREVLGSHCLIAVGGVLTVYYFGKTL